MTNLLASLTLSIVTNWTTVATINNGPHADKYGVVHAVYISPTIVQTGVIQSNTVATFVYEGQTNSIVVKSVTLQAGMTRQISELELRHPQMFGK